MKKILFILGTRPEVIKLAPIINLIKTKKQDQFQAIVCATSQHRTMQDQMLKIFGIEPDIDLNIMKPNQDLYYLTGALIQALKPVMQEQKPDIAIVQGDTTTVLMGSLAAYYANIPIGHVEAGLRTHNRRQPFPEEINRTLAAPLVDYHFAPTSTAKENLLQENITEKNIYITGNTVIDAVFWMKQHWNTLTIEQTLPKDVVRIIQSKQPYILITGHRRESFGEGFLSICTAIKLLAEKYKDHHFIYPVHLNPNVQKPVFDILQDHSNIHLIDPVSYEQFVYLMDNCYLVLTDSGGVQEEAPSLGKPVLVMRETTERPEGVIAGTAKLVGTNHNTIVDSVSELIDNKQSYEAMAIAVNPYGDGHASENILKILQETL